MLVMNITILPKIFLWLISLMSSLDYYKLSNKNIYISLTNWVTDSNFLIVLKQTYLAKLVY